MELILYCRCLCFFINLFKLEKFDLEKKAKQTMIWIRGSSSQLFLSNCRSFNIWAARLYVLSLFFTNKI